MPSRIEFIELENNIKDVGIRNINIYSTFDSFISCINAINVNNDPIIKINLIKKSESKTKELINLIISKINPDLNWLIKADSESNDSYKKLIECLGNIVEKMDKTKENLINNLSNKEYIESNRITNSITIDFYSSYLVEIVNDLIYTPIKSAIEKFIFLELKDKQVKLDSGILYLRGDDGGTLKILKDKNLFWFFVFSHMFRSAQVVGYMSQQKIANRIPDLKELRKIIMSEYRRMQMQKKSEEPEETEGSKEKEIPPDHKEVKEKEILKVEKPNINGADEMEDEDEGDEDSDFGYGDDSEEEVEEDV